MEENTNLGFYYCINCRHIAKTNGALENIKCEKCNSDNCVVFKNKITIPFHEMDIIRKISTNNKFWQAMVELQENNIIDYELKMNQFREQIERQKEAYDNRPKCPTCGSHNIVKIDALERVGSVAMFGLFSKKINKTFKCKNCGHTW